MDFAFYFSRESLEATQLIQYAALNFFRDMNLPLSGDTKGENMPLCLLQADWEQRCAIESYLQCFRMCICFFLIYTRLLPSARRYSKILAAIPQRTLLLPAIPCFSLMLSASPYFSPLLLLLCATLLRCTFLVHTSLLRGIL